MEPTLSQHEETIVPVKPGLTIAAAARRPAQTASSSSPLRWVVMVVVGAVALAAAAMVFFLLPRWAAEEKSAAAAATARAATAAAAAAAAVQAKPVLSAAEAAALQNQSQSLLSALLTQQKNLGDLHADAWAGDSWNTYSTLARSGDDAYLAKDYREAVARYTDAASLGEQLLARSAQIVANALAAAHDAIAAGNAAVAVAQFDIVLGVEPDNAVAQAGRARAERLPEVQALVQSGDAQRAAGDLKAAAASYREALAIDPQWERASTSLAAVSGNIKEVEFEHAMSLGYSALAAERYGDAEQQFKAALAMRPQAAEAQEGLAQSEQGQKLDKISLVEARAAAFEKRELWDQAIAQYRAVLETDPNLAFAQTGLVRAQARAGLEAKLVNLIESPTLLFSDSVLGDARRLVEDAKAQPERGPKLEEQIAKLDRLVGLASAPVTVELRSDQLTEVTLYRVGALGLFASKQVDVRPGTYTAIGSRNGYRDVRRTFTVLPGRAVPPVDVVCAERI